MLVGKYQTELLNYIKREFKDEYNDRSDQYEPVIHLANSVSDEDAVKYNVAYDQVSRAFVGYRLREGLDIPNDFLEMSTQEKEEELFKYLSYTKGITDRDNINAEITKMALLCPPHIANECDNDIDKAYTVFMIKHPHSNNDISKLSRVSTSADNVNDKKEELTKYLIFVEGITNENEVESKISDMALMCPSAMANELGLETTIDKAYLTMHINQGDVDLKSASSFSTIEEKSSSNVPATSVETYHVTVNLKGDENLWDTDTTLLFCYDTCENEIDGIRGIKVNTPNTEISLGEYKFECEVPKNETISFSELMASYAGRLTTFISDNRKIEDEMIEFDLKGDAIFDIECYSTNDEDMTFTITHNADVSYHDWRSDKNV